MKKKLIGLLLLCSLTFLLASCEEYVSPIMFKPSEQNDIPSEYPATINVDYYIANEAENLYGKEKYVTFLWYFGGKTFYYKAFPAKKTDDGYIILGSEHEEYALPNPSKFGYSDIYELKKKNGTFTMTFESKRQYKDFFEDDYISGISEVCDYYKCSQEKEKKE